MTGARPLASVIIPSHNRRALLIEAMDSVRAQSYRPLELIVVDDGSTDGTAEAVAAWIEAQKDAPDFQALLLVQPNAGAPAARNWGFAAARGAYIQYLDSDDLLGPEKIATAARILARDPEVDMVCAGMEILDTATGARRRFEGADLAARPTPAEIALRMSQTMIPVFRRAVIHAAGPWDEHLAALQDWEFFARALLHVRRAAAVPGVHCVMRQHPGARPADRCQRRRGTCQPGLGQHERVGQHRQRLYAGHRSGPVQPRYGGATGKRSGCGRVLPELCPTRRQQQCAR